MLNQNNIIIGIPVYNDKESLMETIASIFYSVTTPYKIVFIESESIDGATKYCDDLANNFEHIEVIHTKKEGPLKAYNRLFDLAREQKCDLLLSQTDVIYPKLYKRCWLGEFQRSSKIKEVGALVPINGGGTSGIDYINGFEWIGGWCTYIPYRTLEKGIKFDEKFPNGYGVDIDLTMQIVKAGLKIGVINYWVDHHCQNEREHDNNIKSELMKKESAEYFRNKWGIKNV